MNIEKPAGIRHRLSLERGLWGTISPDQAKYLMVNDPYGTAKVELSPASTVRSVGLTLIEVFEKPKFARFSTSRVWATVLSHFRREHPWLLIVDGVQHLGGIGQENLRRSAEIRDLLRSLLLHGAPFVCVGRKSGARFLLNDAQLRVRYRGSVSL